MKVFFKNIFFRERAKGLHINILKEKNVCYTTQSFRPTYVKGRKKKKPRKREEITMTAKRNFNQREGGVTTLPS
jgi:hypothetical protein